VTVGFFSYTCAKTGLPIMAGEAWRKKQHSVMTEVKVLYPNGDRISGTYDGYGRVDGTDIVDDKDAKFVLAAFYKGENYEELGVSGHEPGQGYFHDEGFIESMFWHAGEGLIDTHQYIDRLSDYQQLSYAGLKQVAMILTGSDDTGILWTIDGLTRDIENAEDREDMNRVTDRFKADVADKLIEPLARLPICALAGAANTMSESVQRAARKEVMRAWRDNVPCADIDWGVAMGAHADDSKPRLARP
jgi:hypothetical protein